ncbi:MAG: hypothetical protein ACYS0J_21085, partial [Planctomycetota bacterium]
MNDASRAFRVGQGIRVDADGPGDPVGQQGVRVVAQRDLAEAEVGGVVRALAVTVGRSEVADRRVEGVGETA